MVYVAPFDFKHESESLFQNLAIDIIEVRTIGGIVLLGRDLNAHIITLLDAIDINDLCELLSTPELAKTKQPSN